MAKKIVNSAAWLSQILNETMFKLPQKTRAPLIKRNMKLLDGSMVVQGGNKGKRGGGLLRIHMSFNLTEGAMQDVLLTDEHIAESVTVFEIKPDDIIIGDAGFGKGNSLAHVVSCKADALFRATPNQLCLSTDEKGKNKIDMAQMLTNTQSDLLDYTCHIHTKNRKYHPVRIIASRLPEDKAILAKKRKKRKASKRQSQIKERTLVFAEWTILITSLCEEYCATELLAMYRARWQIELLFKRIKQSFKLSKLPPATMAHSRSLVLLWLIIWVMTEQTSLAMEMVLLEKEDDMSLYSPWTIHAFVFLHLKSLVTYLLAVCLDPLSQASCAYSRLRNHRSSRVNQYFLFRFS